MLDTFVQLLPELGVAVGQTFLMLAIALAASIPVSYTHLTLPTICSV